MEDPAESQGTVDPETAEQRSMTPAGPIRRLVATHVDMAVFCGLCALFAAPLIRSIDWSSVPLTLAGLVEALSNPSWVSHASGVFGMWIALWLCYFAVGWGIFGATPGKWVAGIKVVDHKGRYPIGLTRGVMRLVAYGVSSITLGFGHLLLVFRADRRALHDVLAGTRIVRREHRQRPRSKK